MKNKVEKLIEDCYTINSQMKGFGSFIDAQSRQMYINIKDPILIEDLIKYIQEREEKAFIAGVESVSCTINENYGSPFAEMYQTSTLEDYLKSPEYE